MKSSSSTKTSAPAETPEQILVGVIVRPHGIRGEVAVQLHSDNPARFASGTTFQTANSSRRRSGAPEILRVARAVPHRQGLRVAFEGIADRTAAETLTGIELTVPRADVPRAAAGSYYLFDLAGCRAFDEREGDLGAVVDVVADGGGWLIVVEQEGDDGTRRIALPFVEEFLVNVDVAAKRIDWRLPEGLTEACASRS
jgi:16S rRNA processing protein RimM